MTTADSRVTHRLLLNLLCFLLTSAAVAATCSFPDYLQSRDGARRWRSHVTSGGDRCAWRDISFVGDLWEIRVASSTDCSTTNDAASTSAIYRRRCVTSFSRHRYIVRHDAITVTDAATSTGTGNTSHYDVSRGQFGGYACVEFVQRSTTVVQLRESTPTWTTTRFRETVCNGGGGMTLTTDDWVLVDYGLAFFRSSEPCPLADGGFSIRIFDKLSRRGICDAFNDETRVESRCSADENDRIHFRFRYPECIPDELGMGVDQPAYCLASWSDGDAGVFAYTLLRHHRDQRTWCLRYPAFTISQQSTSVSGQLRHSFTAYLFRDAFCDRSRTDLTTVRYLMIDFIPSLSPVVSDGDNSSVAGAEGPVDGHLLCRDDYEACEFWRQPCRHAGSAKMLSCSRRCGICNDNRPAACELPQYLRGPWNSKLRPSRQQSDSMPLNNVVITQHFVQINGANVSLRLHCVTWESPELIATQYQPGVSSTMERMFVRTYRNGCRPRYECIQFRLAAPGVLLYRQSRYRIWPFNGTTGVVIDCRSLFTYDQCWYQLLVSASGLHAGCRLPVDVVDEELNVELKSGLRCRGVLQLIASSSNDETEEVVTDAAGFKLRLRDCPAGHDSEQVYRCLDSTGPHEGEQVLRAVLVSADSAGGDLLCWWFGLGDSARFLLLSAPACYDARMAATIQPLAVFTRSTSSNFTSTAVTPTSVLLTVSRELSKPEVKHAADATNASDDVATYWRLLVALACVAGFLTTCYI